MLIEDILTYLALFIVGSSIGIPFGSWINSKLLTRTWKGEIDKAKKEAVESEEYKILTELLHSINDLVKSNEARHFFTQLTKAMTQFIGTEGSQDDEDDVLVMPEKDT